MTRGNRRLHHPEPGEPVPLELERTTSNPPTLIEEREEYTSFASFFSQQGAFSWDHIHRFIRLEDSWPVHFLPQCVTDQDALRLHVWKEALPTPYEHLEESEKRLPVIRNASNLRPFFTTYARSTFDPKVGENTTKCCICGSNLLGFPMSDHLWQNCPFVELEGDDRILFIAINSIGFCQDCNSRSGSHHKRQCKPQPPRPCTECGRRGHTAALSLCYNNPLGQDTDEARNTLFNIVDEHRRKSLETIQREIKRDCRYKYRSHVDSRYLFWDKWPNNKLTGWTTYKDPARKFPQIPLNYYSNYNKGLPTEFPNMKPAELWSTTPPGRTLFREPIVKYLNEIGDIVRDIRLGASPTKIKLPALPLDEGEGPASPRLAPHQLNPVQGQKPLPRGPDHTVRVLMEPPIRVPPRPSESRATTSGSHQRPLCPPTSYNPRAKQHQSSHKTENTKSAHKNTKSAQQATVQGSQHHLTNTAQDTRKTESSASESLPLLEEANPTESETHGSNSEYSNHSSAINATIPTTIGTSNTTLFQATQGISLVKVEETMEMEREKAVMKSARMWCKEVMHIGNEPSRPAFQKDAFKQIPLEVPDGLEANIMRAQTLIHVLTGDNVHTTPFMAFPTEQIQEYNLFLSVVAEALAKEQFILVTFETNPDRFALGTKEGSLTLMIPSIGIFYKRALRRALDGMTTPGCNWNLPDQLPLSRWFRDPANNSSVTEQANSYMPQFPYTGYCRMGADLLNINLLSISSNPMDLVARLRWLQPFTTGEPIKVPLEAVEYHLVHDYVHLLMGAVRVMHSIHQQSQNIVKVTLADNPSHLVEAASGGLTLAIPSFELFKAHPMLKWRVWLDVTWNQLVDERKWITACPCPALHMQFSPSIYHSN